MTPELAVVVTTHAPYLRWLGDALSSIARQCGPGIERCVVLDGIGPETVLGEQWRPIRVSTGAPTLAREAGLAATAAPWVVFWDADNVMPDGYLRAMLSAVRRADPALAVLYPDLAYGDERCRPLRTWRVPDYDYWTLRAGNYIDTAAAWRRTAVRAAGGWDAGLQSHDDYSLALRITALGWDAERVDGATVLRRGHPDQRGERRRRSDGFAHDLWRCRSLGIVSLLAGRTALLPAWRDTLLNLELPPRVVLHVLDNSGDPGFAGRVRAVVSEVADRRSLAGAEVRSLGHPYQGVPAEHYLTVGRHAHVAALYRSALVGVGEDTLLTLEDDVQPPPEAVRLLGEEVSRPQEPGRAIGVAGAAYSMPHHPQNVCAGTSNGDPDSWGDAPAWSALPAGPFDVNSVGGGCTVWAGWALRGLRPAVEWSTTRGWDGVLCSSIRRRGFRVRLHAGIRCTHHAHGVLNAHVPPADSSATSAPVLADIRGSG